MGPTEDTDDPVTSAVRRCATAFLAEPGLLDTVDQEILVALRLGTDDDPGFVRAVSASNRSNCLHWVRAVARDPFAPVAPNLSPDVLDTAVEVVRRDLAHMAFDAYRAGQHLLWRAWTDVVLRTVALDPLLGVDNARVVLDATSDSWSTFVSATLGELLEHIDRVRADLARDVRPDPFHIVSLLLDGEPLSDARARQLLRYDLRRRHGAAIVWRQTGEGGDAGLERSTERALRAAGATQTTMAWASPHTLWVWWNDADDVSPSRVADLLDTDAGAGLRAAVGSSAPGRDGFRLTHHHARTVQRLMLRAPHHRVVLFADVEAITLVGQDPGQLRDFLDRTLGALREKPTELRHTLRIYLGHQSNAARCARALHAHRNTVISRVERAMELVPAGRHGRLLELQLALEVDHWLSPGG